MNSSTADSSPGANPDASIDPTSGPTVEELLELGSATLGESGARLTSPRLRAAWSGARVAGPVLPVRCTPGDNLAVHVAVAAASPGSVLAVDVGQVAERGYWGEVLTIAALARGIAGLVIDGGVRDVEALERHRFPVFSATVALRGATKQWPGSVGRPVRVGGAPAEPGDWLVGRRRRRRRPPRRSPLRGRGCRAGSERQGAGVLPGAGRGHDHGRAARPRRLADQRGVTALGGVRPDSTSHTP